MHLPASSKRYPVLLFFKVRVNDLAWPQMILKQLEDHERLHVVTGTDPDARLMSGEVDLRPSQKAATLSATALTGAREAGRPAFFVVTSNRPESVRLTELDWTFITTGLPDAVAAARQRAEAASAASGKDLDVVLMGGGTLIASALAAGLVDGLSLHLSPVIVGAGTPLFTDGPPRNLIQRGVVATSTATHLTYEVLD